MIAAIINDPEYQFDYAFFIGVTDCTMEMTEGGGLNMVRELRLMPGDKYELTLTLKRKEPHQRLSQNLR